MGPSAQAQALKGCKAMRPARGGLCDRLHVSYKTAVMGTISSPPSCIDGLTVVCQANHCITGVTEKGRIAWIVSVSNIQSSQKILHHLPPISSALSHISHPQVTSHYYRITPTARQHRALTHSTPIPFPTLPAPPTTGSSYYRPTRSPRNVGRPNVPATRTVMVMKATLKFH